MRARLDRLLAWIRNPRIVWRKETPTRQTSIEVIQWLPYPLFAVLLGWYIAAPSVTVALCLATVGGVIVISYIWARQMAERLSCRRVLQYSAMQVGDELEEQVHLINQSVLPAIWAEFQDRSDLPGYTVNGVRGASGLSISSWRVHTICSRRGVFALGPWELHTGDPLGLFEVKQVIPDRQEVLVYPPLASLPEDLLPYKGAQGEHRPLRQPITAETVDGMTVREFVHGDPLRHIHWPTSARMEKPFVKVFEPHSASRLWILPDLDPLWQVGDGDDSTEETIVMLAASLAAEFLKKTLQVGLFSGGDAPTIVTPNQGQLHLWKILEKLAPLHPAPGLSLAATLDQIRPLIQQKDLLVVVTASLDVEWVRALQRKTGLRNQHPAHILLLDPSSFGGTMSAEDFKPVLASAGFDARVIRQGEIQPLIGVYGALSRWEFITFGTGRAVARRSPRRAAEIIAGRGGLA